MNRVVRLGLLILLTAALFALSLMAGKQWIPFDAWFGHDPRWAIIAELRIPRAVLGVLLGAALGLSGAVLQGYLRNPLADPTVIGVSSCAALGAVASIVLGFGAGWLGQFGWAMAGAGGAMALLAMLTARAETPVVFRHRARQPGRSADRFPDLDRAQPLCDCGGDRLADGRVDRSRA